MIQILIKIVVGLLGLVIVLLLAWPSILANYAWYSAVNITKDNPAIAVIPQADLDIHSDDIFEYTNVDMIQVPHIFENTIVEYQSSEVLAIIDADSNARFLVSKSEPKLPLFLKNDIVLAEDINIICRQLKKINGNNPCDHEEAFLHVLLSTSKDTIGLFSSKEVKLYGSVLLQLKDVYITPDTTDINTYTASSTTGFIQYTPNGILANVFVNENTNYDIASYNISPEVVELLVATIKKTEL